VLTYVEEGGNGPYVPKRRSTFENRSNNNNRRGEGRGFSRSSIEISMKMGKKAVPLVQPGRSPGQRACGQEKNG